VGFTVLAMLAVAGGVIVWWPDAPREFATGRGERRSEELEDGSRVELNAETRLAVQFGRTTRRVQLYHGEALFTVAKDAARPFFVTARESSVRVTGTVFNVWAHRPGRVEVTVLAGAVGVRPGDGARERVLSAGRQAIVGGTVLEFRELREGGAEDVAAWRHGQAVFHDTPLSEALERFSTYHAQAIVADPGAADQRLGGRYALDDLPGFLDSIERVLLLRVVREANGTLRVIERTARK
jgi:transmembrane sensor